MGIFVPEKLSIQIFLEGVAMNTPLFENRRRDQQRLIISILLTASVAGLEYVGGYLTGSLSLMSDAGHATVDVSALGIALLAVWEANKQAVRNNATGHTRIEMLSALFNGVLLLSIGAIIIIKALGRLANPATISVEGMLFVASVGFVANAAIVILLRHRDSINIRGAFWHVLGDMLTSVGVIIGGVMIKQTGWFLIDPIISLGIACIITVGALRLIRDSIRLLR
ncbi:hypothetical protein A2Z33_03290 [Candidatus Gottesmanbacteria bacterium RBG_16_52_11]|uniref:Cation efflux protein transmembrane domain-containing protein n=1 Tax=Candidatus Gottesmanbacteria bacterium RBG_16_52_11 TaxID=1798374 RepID=A0A1F5YW11_9BACT|nr:MAG: hypothetical protein A2Z33_03290 [Candidatus Gottesmanbacteria bacterium RBG_16_52_11]